MTIQIINTGSSANAGNGDSIRSAFNKVNNNFVTLQTLIGTTATSIVEQTTATVISMFVHNDHVGITATVVSNKIILTGSTATGAGGNGAQGAQGVQGAIGIQGSIGNQGLTGPSILISGTYATETLLPVSAEDGTGYLIADTGHLFVFGGGVWTDVGQIQGPQGPQGAGFQGIQGAIGNQGVQGAQGFGLQGLQGIQGGIGLQGVQGGIGLQGIQGGLGDLGPQGIPGIQGAQGRQGLTGTKGFQGFQGAPGVQGAGSQGIQGAQGVPGSGANSDQELFTTSSVIFSSLTATTIEASQVNGHWIPQQDLIYDLGSTSSQWRSLYVGTSTVYFGGIPLTVSASGIITVDGNPITSGNANTGSFAFTNTTMTVPDGDTMTIQANHTDGLLGGQLRMSPDSGRIQLIAGAAESSQLYTGAWSTATYTGTEIIFSDAAGMISWLETSNWAIAYNKKFSINGGAKLPYDGYSGGGSNITIYTSVAADPDPTTVTSIEFFYHLQSSIDIDYDDGRFDLYATMSIYIDNSDVQGPDIWLQSGDDITLQAKTKTTSDTEGGDINIYAGNGGPGDAGDGGGTGGDLQIRAGAGGDASTSYQAGQGGFFQILGGIGGAANASQNAGNGGYVTITAGDGGDISQATANQGGAGGYIEIVAGDSTRQNEPGGYVLITSGAAGPGALAGAVDISIDASDLGPGGNWSFDGHGSLTIPKDIYGSGANAVVVQNTASGVAYLELPVDPSTDDVILANQDPGGSLTLRTGDFGSEKDWTFDQYGNLTPPSSFSINHDGLMIGSEGTYVFIDIPNNANAHAYDEGLRLANNDGPISLSAGLQGSTFHNWKFNTNGGIDLPGGGSISTNAEDIAILAGNDGTSTFGSVTINTQAPPAVYTIVQQYSPFSLDTITTDGTATPNIASIVAGMEVTGNGITATTTVTNVSGPDIYDAYFITISPASDTGLNYNETYTFTAGTVTDRNWEFNSLGEMYLPRGGAIQETDVTNELWGTTTTSLTLVPGGAANGTQRLEIYSTGGGEGDHIHITSGDQTQTDLFLGNDTQYFAVAASGYNVIRARSGIDSPASGMGAGAGSSVTIYAGSAGDNGGDPADGASGGDIFAQAGIGSAGYGGNIYLQSGAGQTGYGNILLSTDGGSNSWIFDRDDNLTFPSGGSITFDSSASSNIYGVTSIEFANATTQTTAFTGTAALLDITNTNGLATTYYLTFVENRSDNQEVRADVDLTYETADNILGVGRVSVNSTTASTSTTTGALTVAGGVGIQGDIYAGNIYSNGVQLTAGGGGASGVTSITAGTGTFVSTSTGDIVVWIGNTSNLEETFESKTTGTGVTVFDCTTNRLFYQTGLTGNITPNFTNLNLATGEATSISIVVVQGGTARNISGIQVAGTTTGVTLLWQGAASAPSGNASRTDVFTFSILSTASSAYTILGMLTSFGGV